MHEVDELGFGPWASIPWSTSSLSLSLSRKSLHLVLLAFSPSQLFRSSLTWGPWFCTPTGIGPRRKKDKVSILRFLEYPGRMATLCRANGLGTLHQLGGRRIPACRRPLAIRSSPPTVATPLVLSLGDDIEAQLDTLRTSGRTGSYIRRPYVTRIRDQSRSLAGPRAEAGYTQVPCHSWS